MVKTQDGYDPVVSVANTNKELIDWIMKKVPTGALTGLAIGLSMSFRW
jgi:hypothetical protein